MKKSYRKPRQNTAVQSPRSQQKTPKSLEQDTVSFIDNWMESQKPHRKFSQHPVGHTTHSLGRKWREQRESESSEDPQDRQTRLPNNEAIPRDQKDLPYISARFLLSLKAKGIFMRDFKDGMSHRSREICEKLLETGNLKPESWIFKDGQFVELLEMLKYVNESTLIHELLPWLVPPTKLSVALGNEKLKVLRPKFNLQWTRTLPLLTSMLPQPDYAVGFEGTAFEYKLLKSIGLDVSLPSPYACGGRGYIFSISNG